MKLAVALNGFPVSTQEANGAGTEYFDIVIGEPDDTLFLPPQGAIVKNRNVVDILPPQADKPYQKH